MLCQNAGAGQPSQCGQQLPVQPGACTALHVLIELVRASLGQTMHTEELSPNWAPSTLTWWRAA
jgi:hypothetical protein